MKLFRLPDLGEGLPDAEIREWYVKEGDVVELDQPIVAMETAKALVDVPSPYAGKIIQLFGAAGDRINTDEPLVGYEGEAENNAEKEKTDSGTVVGKILSSNQVLQESATGVNTSKATNSIRATPAVRALAKQLGVDLSLIRATGHNGMISSDDVKNATASDSPKLENSQALSAPRRAMAHAMSTSHREVVPVTVVDDADLHAWEGKNDISIRLIRAIAKACNTEPMLNATFDGKNLSYRLNAQINLGIAVDTPHGLYVPVVYDVDQQDDASLRATINRFKQQAQDRNFTPDDLKNATIVLSNFGTVAGRYANPIVTPPMVAIIGVGKLHDEVVANNGQMEIHRRLPISLSIDHRAITGGEAARFLKVVLEEMAKPNLR